MNTSARLRVASVLAILMLVAGIGSGVDGPRRVAAHADGDGADTANASGGNSLISLRHSDVTARREATTQEKSDAARNLKDAEQRNAPDWLLNSLRSECGQLEVLGLLYAQQEVTIEIRDELTIDLESDDRDASQRILDEIEQIPPYGYLFLDALRDDLDEAVARNDVFDVELNAAREQLGHAREDEKRQHRERRQIKEKLSRKRQSSDRIKIERELVLAEQRCQINTALADLRELEVDVISLEKQLHARSVEDLEAAVRLVEADVVFSDDELDQKITQIDRAEANIRDQLAQFQQHLATQDAPPQSGSELSGSSADSDLADDDIGLQRDLARKAIGELNEALAELVMQRYVWKERFRQVNQQATPEEIEKTREQLSRFAHYLDDAREVLELRLKDSRMQQAALDSGVAQDVTARRRELVEQLCDVTEHRAELLSQTHRLVGRFQRDLVEDRPLASVAGSLLGGLKELQTYWGYEVFAVDDRPITIGKIVIATVMLFGGLYLSRHLSRMLGRRMLPRLGVHEGASLALQTIAFYVMVIVCGFFTLDMLNIPLTVFTFFGGAAAIAIGFGSQNILNNFMSGLIILGEQPIRVGDLVEIDGLHANIEHIGPRSTRVRTGSNLEIIVPNSRFLENNVTNWTLSSNEIRACVKVGVAYGSPVDVVMTSLRQAVDEEENALPHPEPIILFTDFADNSLNFEVHFWVRMQTIMQGRRVESTLRQRIDALFRSRDITIAFPQRDVHLDVTRPIEIRLPNEEPRMQVHSPLRAA